jgi:hypothetical protein
VARAQVQALVRHGDRAPVALNSGERDAWAAIIAPLRLAPQWAALSAALSRPGQLVRLHDLTPAGAREADANGEADAVTVDKDDVLGQLTPRGMQQLETLGRSMAAHYAGLGFAVAPTDVQVTSVRTALHARSRGRRPK